MSDFEALMWNLDKDPRLSSTIANLTILDRAPDMDRLRARLHRAAIAVPRLRQKVVGGPGRLAPPAWRWEHDLDLNYHVRQVSLGRRRSVRALNELVATLFMVPFDRTRPLWEFIVIEGLPGDRAAMLQKIHHTVTDGQGGLRLSEQFIDLSRDAPEPDPLPEPDSPTEPDSFLSGLTDAVAHLTRRQIGVTRRAVGEITNAMTHPNELIGTGRHMFNGTTSALRQARTGGAPLSPLWTERSLRRVFGTVDVPLDGAKAAARALGGTINDFFVTGAVAGAAEYHRRHGVELHELRMAMPISTRSDTSAGGNMFSPSQCVVPAGKMTAVDRFEAVRKVLNVTKAEPMVDMVDAMAGVLNLLPTSVLARASYSMSSSVDFVTSNLRGAPIDLYLAGARMEANYPLGPIAGTAFNLSTMSYRGTLCMGAVIDAGAVEDPAMLLRCLNATFTELLAAGS